MNRIFTKKVSSKKPWYCFIALALILGLQSADVYGQCQGFFVSITSPAEETYCPGDTVTITSTVTGGTGPYTYSWSTGGTDPTETAVAPLNSWFSVNLMVTDANGCVAFSNTIHIKPVFWNASIFAFGGPACEGQGTIQLQVNVSFGGNYTYLWSNGETVNPITVSTGGLYTVTVTNTPTGCTKVLEVEPNFIPLPEPEISGPANLCPDNIGILEVLGGPYNLYEWSPGGQSSPQITINGPGIYSVTVTDNFGCSGVDVVEILPFPIIPPNLDAPPFLCPEGDGTVQVINQSDYVSFSWSTGQTTPSFVGFPGESYQVTVTDFNGCTDIASVSIGVYSVTSPAINGEADLCEGQEEVEMTVLPSFQEYAWSTNETTQSVIVNTPGLYSVTVTDVNGCTTQGEHLILPSPLPEPVIPQPAASCEGSPIELTVNNGPYPTYEWSNGETTPTITVSQSGNYIVTVSNVFGCTTNTNLEVNLSTGPTATIAPATYECDGSMTLNAGGGGTYLWSNGDTTTAIIVQNSGNYSVIVTDSSGCADTVAEVINIPVAPEVSITGTTGLCTGASGELEASSGFGEYLWTGGDTTAVISVSQPGTYEVTVTDDNGCTATSTQPVAANPSPEPEVTGPPGFCEGTSATLGLAQSFPQMVWSNGDETQNITVSQPGTYDVTVTDTLGCTATDDWVLEEFALPSVAIEGPASICSGTSGSFSVPGGFSQIAWSTGDTTTNITVTQAGTYQVTITDANGCTANNEQELQIATSPTPVIATPAISCIGTATLDAGSGFVTYLWSNGGTGTTITVSANGAYSVTVTNGAGCTGEDAVTVSIPAPPTVGIAGPTAVCEGEMGTLTAGPGFVSYSWSNGETATSTDVSQPGTYSVVATDINGCTAEASFAFDNYPLPTVLIEGPLSICTGSSTSLEVSGSFSQINWNTGETTSSITVSQAGVYTVEVTDANGCTNDDVHELETGDSLSPVITEATPACDGTATLDAGGGYSTYLWSNGGTGQNITVTANGNYIVTVSDGSGCSGTAQLAVDIPVPPQVSISGPASACESEMATLAADLGFVSYNWSNGATTSSIAVSQTGTYTVEVSDANGCTATDSQPFEYFAAPAAVINGAASICTGSETELNVSGNFTQIIWNTGETTNSITVSQSGTYTVEVSDANGCTASGTHELLTGTSLSPVITTTDVSCNGTATLSAGAGFTNFFWSNGETEPNITVNANGLYAVTVSDASGCSGETSLMVNLPAPPLVDILGANSICTGSSTQFSVPDNFPQIEWNTGETTPTITVASAGIYGVTVTDSNGCTATDELELGVSDSLSPDITSSLEDCDGTSTLDAGPGFATYQWSTGSSSTNIVIATNGLYTVTVSDANGCTGVATLDIILPEAPVVTIAGATAICEGDDTELVAPGSFVQYLWNTGETTPTITVGQGGIYSVTVSDANGCTATDQWTLTQLQSDYNFVQLDACSTQDTGTVEFVMTNQFGCDSLVVIQTSLAPALTTTVAFSACEGSVTTYNGIQIVAGDTQEFVFNAANGCDSVVTVSVTAFPAVAFDLSTTEACSNALDGTVQVSMQNGTAPFQYALNGGNYQGDPVFTDLPSGLHLVEVSDANGCILEETIDIPQKEPLEILVEDMELSCDQTSVILRPTVVSGNLFDLNWQWPDGSTAPWMLVENSGNYFLQIGDGCEVQEFTMNVSWEDDRSTNSFFFVPNSFSPNYDGINDLFRVFPGVDFKVNSFEFRVFDRWGDMMFGTTNLEEGWNGMYKEVQKQPSVYVWYLKAKVELCGGREIDIFREGGVTIVR